MAGPPASRSQRMLISGRDFRENPGHHRTMRELAGRPATTLQNTLGLWCAIAGLPNVLTVGMHPKDSLPPSEKATPQYKHAAPASESDRGVAAGTGECRPASRSHSDAAPAMRFAVCGTTSMNRSVPEQRFARSRPTELPTAHCLRLSRSGLPLPFAEIPTSACDSKWGIRPVLFR
jgi:hypothetical protein